MDAGGYHRVQLRGLEMTSGASAEGAKGRAANLAAVISSERRNPRIPRARQACVLERHERDAVGMRRKITRLTKVDS